MTDGPALAAPITAEAMMARIGQHLGTSDWLTIDQAMIDRFADVTDDRQFIHVDPIRAAESPFGATIAHGFLTLSLLSRLRHQAVPAIAGLAHGINAGFDRIRFIEPVRAGSRIRGHFRLLDCSWRKPGYLESLTDVTIEIEGTDRPALVAAWRVIAVIDAA